MQFIATTTVGAGGASSIVFSSIPNTFTDLYLAISARNTSGSSDFTVLRMNSVNSGYEWRTLNGEEYGGVGSYNSSSFGMTDTLFLGQNFGTNATSNTFSSTLVHIANYTSSTGKVFSSQSTAENNNAAPTRMNLVAGSCTSTAAISSLTIYGYFGYTFAQNTTATLYGILKGSGGATVS